MSRKDIIVQTASKMFKEHGYASTTMRSLATELGVEAASIYSHITSKNEILSDICFGMARQFHDRVIPILNKWVVMSPDEVLRAAIVEHVAIIIKNIDASVVFFSDWRHLEGKELIRFKALRKQYEDAFLRIIELGADQKIFTTKDPTFSTLMLFSSMNWIYQWYQLKSHQQPQYIAELIAETFINGIKTKEQ